MFDAFAIGIAGLICLLALIAVRVPIAYTMILVGFVGIILQSGPTVLMNQLKDLAYSQFSNYDLSVLPMFILMGGLASRCGLSRDLFRGANAWLGRFRGGVAMAAVAACGGFGAVCGSSTATASTMGQVALPELKRYNYSPALATGTIAAGGTLGILIPPSVVLIVYAIIVEANVVTMFAAALIPGILATLLFMLTVAIYVRLVPGSGPEGKAVTRDELLAATLAVIPVAVVFGIVIGGIYAGIYNPTAAAAIGVFLVTAYGLVMRRLTLAGMGDALLETARTSGMIFLILLGAELLKIFMARAGVPQAAAELLQGSGLSPMAILILVIILYLILGCLMDSLSMVILTVPFFWPVVAGLDYGLDPGDLKIWFGIVILIVVELGLITPPIGLNVFIINAQAPDVPMRQTFKGVMPFFGAEVFRIALLVAFPAITLFLPKLLQ
ncbi:C4-dicarboxylate ABC transporter permease [Mesorhizobium sp. L-8-10]|uniref:TRAP transporter large permease n=1 Tax=unclassified Mesorhizobium TaxID=325217 RepID=UPI001927A477|nr:MULTISPECIES: TRAP transporter large permease subunit [unclassified Mesorhizobium]BCH22620.1 C4-dicarboxylate ABC transporter permease [Mesorhizobium sp. L-8-3]BCH30422.1 C4-dicarboxylate ABC transporter permease [Mesorhizobium sp. L-8-10]